ncbi:MAG: STAS domain-containing protein [Acidimicrobiales bacterium]
MVELNEAVARIAERSDASVTISLHGELDAASSAAAHEVLDEALGPDVKEVVFEMGELTFMDSSGIATLIHAANRAGRVRLRNANDMIARIIEVTGLTEVLPIDP